MNLRDQLLAINHTDYQPPSHTIVTERVKGLIISDINDNRSMYSTRRLMVSIDRSKSDIDYVLYPSSTPARVPADLKRLTYIKDSQNLPWTWPTNKSEEGFCMKSGIYKQYYGDADQSKLISQTVSHMLTWQHCIDINQPVVVLQQNVYFARRFNVAGLREGWQATRHGSSHKNSTQPYSESLIGLGYDNPEIPRQQFIKEALDRKAEYGMHVTPNLGVLFDQSFPKISDCKVVNPFPSIQSYFITPWAARKLLENVERVGMWPVWALMSKELAPWALINKPRYTATQEIEYAPSAKIK